jgi:hypothetical protein
MIVPGQFAGVTAQARIPEQVIPYVLAVSDLKPLILGPCVGFETEGDVVLVGYPLRDPRDTGGMAEAVGLALRLPGLRRITVLGPARPPQAPERAAIEEDCYYSLPVPAPAPGQKTRNLLRRAERELTVDRGGSWREDHEALVQRYLNERPLAAGTRQIFKNLPRYLTESSSSVLFSARLANGRLSAFSVGEYASLSTAFYMFSFRDPGTAPPGATDLLLAQILEEASRRGHTVVNLGLSVNQGIGFFKRKWGAEPFLPYVQSTWETASPGIATALAGLFRRRP